MFLNLREIIEMPGGSVPFECELDVGRLDFPSIGSYDAPPHAVGRVYNEAGVLHLTGTVKAGMTCLCDRCGAEFHKSKTTELCAVIVEENPEDDPELFVLDGDGVELGEILETLFILDMDMKLLCREDCRGLCSRCGKNLNLGTCTCKKQIDPRFAVLEQLLDK